MPNINDIDPAAISTVPPGSVNNIFKVDPGAIQTEEEFNQEKFSAPGQKAIAIAEGAGKGFAGPVATAAEAALTKAGVKGLSPEEQAARAKANPFSRVGAELAGFTAGALTGTGEAGLASKIGEGTVELAGLAKGASALSKIASTGVKVGSEVAALQGADEASKFINQDPNQTLGSAAINIGLSGILGGAGGAVLGSVSPLFKTAANKIGISKLASDFMGETKFLQEAPEIASGASKELGDRLAESQDLLKEVALPEVGGISRGPFPNFPPKPGTSLFSEAAIQRTAEKLAEAQSELAPKIVQGPFPNFPPPPGTPLFNEVKNYLSLSEKLADQVGKVAIENNGELPLVSQLNPTPILDRNLNRAESPGKALAQWAHRKGAEALAGFAGKTVGGIGGGIAGALVGHPIIGAIGGERLLSSIFKNVAKPFAENAVNSEAMRASVDYLAAAIKGEAVLSNSVKSFFQSAEVIPKFLIPTTASRDKLEKSLMAAENPQHLLGVGGNISHYLPNHGIAATSLAGNAMSYLNSIKPRSVPAAPFDTAPPIDKAAKANYNRQLDIAQQPLMVLKHAKSGTLLPQDVQTLHAIYPGLHASMVNKINSELLTHKAAGKDVPYSQRVSLSLLTGSNLDSTMMPDNMQAIIRSGINQQQQIQANNNQKKANATGAQIKAIQKNDSLYATNLEQHQINKRKA